MADIANQLQGAVEGLDRFLEALDNSSMKLGSNAAIESKLARAAQKKADQDLRFRKKIEKMEKETAKREAAHLAQLKAMEPFRKKAFTALKQELKAKTDLIKQTKGLGDALKKTGAGLGSMFKALGSGISKAMSGLGKGFKGGIAAGLGGIMENLKGIQILGVSVGKIIGTIAAGAKTMYEMFSTHEKLMTDITKQTGIMGDTFRDGYRKQVKETHKILGDYGYTLKETLKLTQDMREAFGDVSYVTDQLVATSAQLQMVYRMSADNANELVEAMSRSGYEAGEFLKTVEKTAITMGADVGMAMRDVAKNTQMLELYAGRGEEYFARMATRAAMLGTDMQSIEDSGKAFEDFEQMSENFGKMGQLFGTGFNDGLKAMTDIRMMYERGNMLGIQEHITEQVAKTLYYEDGILKSMKTKDVLYQSQIKQMAATMGMDNVSALRAIKAAEMQEMMNTKNFKIEEDMLKTAESKEIFAASQYDYSMAMFSALRDADMKEEDILKKLSEEGKTTAQIIADRKELVSIAEDEMIKRAKIVKEQEQAENNKGALAEKTLAVMNKLDKVLANMQSNMEENAESFGAKLEEQFGQLMNQGVEISNGVMDGITKGFDEWNPKAGLMDNLTGVLKSTMKGGLDAAFGDLGIDDNTSVTQMFERGLVAAFGGTQTDSLWDLMKTRMQEAWNYGVEKFNNMLLDGWVELKYIFNSLVTEFEILIETAFWDSPQDKKDAKRAREKDKRDYEYAKKQRQLQKDAQAFSKTDEGKAFTKKINSPEGQRQIATAVQTIQNNQRNMFPQLSSGPAQVNTPWSFAEESAKIRAQDQDHADGWAGGRHRGIVGEAGTEVGITRSALRELSSAGIPGYYTGFTNPTGTYAAPGSVASRSHREADNRVVGEPYRAQQHRFLDNLQRNQYDFLDDQEDLNEEEAYIRHRSQKEFFVKYPAIVDEAFGRPFREHGQIATGIYNSIFSGMQAGVRAEFAGASGERQREIAWQHAVAEGIKPGGIINQGLDKLGAIQNQQIHALNGGLEIELEQANKLGEAAVTARENVKKQERIALEAEAARAAMLDNEEAYKAHEIAAINKSHDVAQNQLKELKKIDEAAGKQYEAQLQTVDKLEKQTNRGEAWNRTTSSLLGGIRQGMTAMAGVIASGGSREQALEMGKRGAVGGIIESFTAGFGGKADSEFLQTMNMMGYLTGTKKLPAYTGGDVGDMITEAFNRTERTFQSQGRGLGWGGANAMGRVYNSPHLAVVGEGSQNEIIVPTERIRKGLPINEGVARELASIGVPGYEDGTTVEPKLGYKDKVKAKWGSDEGGWKTGIATAGLSFAQTYMQTGDIGQAAGQAIGSGIGFGASMAISAIPGVGPFIGPILGPMIGSFIGSKLGGFLGYKPRYKKYRERALKLLESHAKTDGLWDHGQPGGIEELLLKAISGGKKKHPDPAQFKNLKREINKSRVIGGPVRRGGGVEPFIALLSGQVSDTEQEDSMYRRYNAAFTGNPIAMADGGIVTRPTNAVVGEAGPEAVIPLNKHNGYASRQQEEDQKNIITELRKQNQQMGMFIKNMGQSKTVLQVDGRTLAETVGQGMYDINSGV